MRERESGRHRDIEISRYREESSDRQKIYRIKRKRLSCSADYEDRVNCNDFNKLGVS